MIAVYVCRETDWAHETNSPKWSKESCWKISRRANLPRFNTICIFDL